MPTAPWVAEEMKDIGLADKRLNKRLGQILDQLGTHPTASIPAACGGYKETAAAYRFFDNAKVGFEDVLQPHIEATYRRMADQPRVIVAQDTSEIDVTRPNQQVVGAGLLDGNARYGAFLHPTVAFTPDGTPLGTVCADVWTREDTPPLIKSDDKRKHIPIEEKESVRWLEGLRQARAMAEELPETHFISVSDSEADIYEVLEEAQQTPQQLDWIIRAAQNRALQKGDDVDGRSNGLREQLLTQEVLFTQSIHVRGRSAKVQCENRGRRQPRESRTAELEVRAGRVTLRAPRRPDRQLESVPVNVVLVTEIDAPHKDAPVEWILLTSLPIDDEQEVRAVIQYYCVRWMIEIFFRTLKSGCRVEDRQFEHIDRLLTCLAVYLIVTWRTLYVCRLGRELPETSCEAVFDPAEWKSVYYVVHKAPPPSTPPNLKEMVRMVAQLGGYVNRKRTDEPGPQTVWLGLQRVHDFANCWLAFGPETRKTA